MSAARHRMSSASAAAAASGGQVRLRDRARSQAHRSQSDVRSPHGLRGSRLRRTRRRHVNRVRLAAGAVGNRSRWTPGRDSAALPEGRDVHGGVAPERRPRQRSGQVTTSGHARKDTARRGFIVVHTGELGNEPPAWFAEPIHAVGRLLHEPRLAALHDRERPLVALPLLGTGAGGKGGRDAGAARGG